VPILITVDDGEERRPRSFWPRNRIRRPSDVARLLLAVGLLLLLAALSVWAPDLGNGLRPGISGLPRDVLAVANAAASLAVLCTQLAVVVDALRRRRYALVTAAMATALGAGLAVAAQKAGEAGWVAQLGTTGDPAVVPVAAGLAFVVGADLQWSRRLRTLAYGALAAATACALALGSLTVPGAVAGVLLGATAGLGVRVAAGVVPSRPREQTVRDVLARAGIRVTALRPLQEAAGRVRYASSDAEGDLVVTVVDPDRRGVTLARRLWRVLRFRTGAVGRPALSLRGGLERRALVAGLARSAHVPVPAVLALLAAGPALVLVERPLDGTPLPAAGRDGGPPDEDTLAEAFSALRRLHGAGLAHGNLTADSVVLVADGAGFTDLWSAQAAAGELQQDLDVVTMLTALAATTGADAVVAALRSGYATTPAAQARLAALLQPLALARPVRRAVHGTAVLDDLRTALTGPDGGPPVHAPRLERIRARTVLSLAGATLAAHVLVTQLSSGQRCSARR
jgi:tRNA A-37 threonylcarbamoyl transferase component Bud32